MGSWNQTCMLTGLPILYGDPCTGFLIARNQNKLRSIGPALFFAPLTTAITGTYDDYGGIENAPAPEPLLAVLENDGCLIVEDGNEPRDAAEWVSAASEGRLKFVHDGKSQPVSGKYVESVWLALVRTDFFENGVAAMRPEYGLDAFRHMLPRLAIEAQGPYGEILKQTATNPELEQEAYRTYLFERYMDAIRRQWMPDAVGGQDLVHPGPQLEFYSRMLSAAKEIADGFM